MKSILIAAGVLLSCTMYGRLGENLDQLKKRFKVEAKTATTPSLMLGKHLIFKKPEMTLSVFIYEKTCQFIMYQPQSGKLTEKELKAILDANMGKDNWKETEVPKPIKGFRKATRYFVSKDGKSEGGIYFGTLQLMTASYKKGMEASGNKP